jgi:hypothetical protein
MNKSKKRFEIQLKKADQLLKTAIAKRNPAFFLQQENIRSLFFHLEGLARAYSAIGPQKKSFRKLLLTFKDMEDMMGRIDNLSMLNKRFESEEEIPEDIRNWFRSELDRELLDANRILKNKGWLGGEKVLKIRSILDDINWDNDKKEYTLLKKFYQSEITKIQEFGNNSKVKFENIESGIHEFRRKLRWLSIYAHAFNGKFQLVDDNEKHPLLDKYLSIDIVNSPYSKLPQLEGHKIEPVRLLKWKFFSISWLIEQLGALKDKGLLTNDLIKAIIATGAAVNENDATFLAKKWLKKTYTPLKSILSLSSRITSTFFKDQVLNNLIQ